MEEFSTINRTNSKSLISLRFLLYQASPESQAESCRSGQVFGVRQGRGKPSPGSVRGSRETPIPDGLGLPVEGVWEARGDTLTPAWWFGKG